MASSVAFMRSGSVAAVGHEGVAWASNGVVDTARAAAKSKSLRKVASKNKG